MFIFSRGQLRKWGLGKGVKEKLGEMTFCATYLEHDVSNLYRQTDNQKERQTDRQTDRQIQKSHAHVVMVIIHERTTFLLKTSKVFFSSHFPGGPEA